MNRCVKSMAAATTSILHNCVTAWLCNFSRLQGLCKRGLLFPCLFIRGGAAEGLRVLGRGVTGYT